MPNPRVVLDTNVLVSGVAYPASIPGRILGMWSAGMLDVILSRYILDEMVRVLPRLPKNRRSQKEIRDLSESFTLFADIVEPAAGHDSELRDPADQPVLATLRASRADCLITGDKDLLALSHRYPVLTPAEFWAKHG